VFKIIDGTRKEQKPASWYMERYADNITSHLKKEHDRFSLCGIAYCMVRCFLLSETDDCHAKFQVACRIRDVMAYMTPSEILRTFPPKKTYDGKKYGCIDYFSTMEKFKGIPINKPIGESLQELLSGYSNDIILDFNVEIMLLVSKLHREQTGRDIFDDFMESQGKPPLKKYYLQTDSKGRQYMVDDDGNKYAVKKPKPRYLKVVK
jgi:hypothetical protein